MVDDDEVGFVDSLQARQLKNALDGITSVYQSNREHKLKVKET
jgi:hypothetical protein